MMLRNPIDYITLYRGSVQIKETALLDLIPRVIKYLEPVHKAQLLGIKHYHQDNSFLTKTHFITLHGIFNRYAAKLKKMLDLKAADDKQLSDDLAAAVLETAAYDKYIEGILSKLSTSQGNFEIRKRTA